MTMQVVLVGSNGLVVGSDRKLAYRTQEGNSAPDYQFDVGDKFVRSRDGSIICFFAGGSHAKSIAEGAAARSYSGQAICEWHYDLRKAAEDVRASSIGDEVIVIRLGGEGTDVALINKIGYTATVSAINQHRCTGVNVKARFLVERFWRKAKVESLRRLALLVLGHAARERPTEVGFGFDLMTIEGGNPKSECYVENDHRIERICDEFFDGAASALFPLP